METAIGAWVLLRVQPLDRVRDRGCGWRSRGSARRKLRAISPDTTAQLMAWSARRGALGVQVSEF